uniref:MADF domain-containing protein n=1 Tax=Glossina palpalis gambiensis TaxID=67801 RepID=A0A1B0BZG2_9MUSC
MHKNTTRTPSVDMKLISTGALINAVRKYEILYNRETSGSEHIHRREQKWDKVALELFPHSTKYNFNLREGIRATIRRRWQRVRDLVGGRVRKMKNVENYARNNEDDLLTQCAFLLPFMNSPNCAMLAQKLGLQKNTSISSGLADGDDDDNNNLEGTDANPGNSPIIGEDIQCMKFKKEKTHLNEVTSPAPEYQNYMKQIDGYDSSVPEQCNFLISNPRSIKVTDENLHFRNKGNDGVEANNSADKNCSNSRKFSNFGNKSSVSDVANNQSQILTRNILNRQRLASQDDCYNQNADLMFLLSLAPDLGKVPPASKAAVKAQIVATIAQANLCA